MSTVDLRCDHCGQGQERLIYSPVRRARMCTECALSEVRDDDEAGSWELFLVYLAGAMSGGLAVYMGLMV